MIGIQLGNCELVKEIGQGGHARIFLGKTNQGEEQAVKVIDDPGDEELHVLFNFEIQALSRLRHPHIVRMLAWSPGYIVLPLGKGWFARAKSIGSYPKLPEVMQMGQQIGSALQYMHEQDMFHGDVSPDNTLVLEKNGEETFLLIDFSATIGPHSKELWASKPMPAVWPRFPPELFRDPGQRATVASDLWMLACSMYFMLSGHWPYRDTATSGTSFKRAKQQPDWDVPVDLSEYCELPEDVERVIMRALSSNPAKRYKSVAAFLEALRNPSQQEEATTCTEDGAVTVSSAKPSGTFSYLICTILVLALSLGIAGRVSSHRNPGIALACTLVGLAAWCSFHGYFWWGYSKRLLTPNIAHTSMLLHLGIAPLIIMLGLAFLPDGYGAFLFIWFLAAMAQYCAVTSLLD